MPMKVLLVTHSYTPESTAPQRRWASFIEYFRQLGWDVDVVAPQSDARYVPEAERQTESKLSFRTQLGRAGERVRRVPFLAVENSRLGRFVGNTVSAALMIPRALLIPEKPDVIVATVPALPNLVSGFAISLLMRRPLVLDMRDAWPDLAREAHLRKELVSVLEFVVQEIQSRADAIVTVTDGFKDVLHSRGMRYVQTIPNGISTRRLKELSALAAVQYPAGKLDRPLHVLYMGNHGESQALERVIDAAVLAGDQVQLRFVGDGTRKEALAAYASERGVSVKFRPVAHGVEAAANYEWADTCIVALRDDWESFLWTVPSKTFELLAVGRHITGVVQGEAARLLATHQNADVVPSDPQAIADLWITLRENPQRMISQSENRATALNSLTFESVSAQYASVLEEVAKRAKGRSDAFVSLERPMDESR